MFGQASDLENSPKTNFPFLKGSHNLMLRIKNRSYFANPYLPLKYFLQLPTKCHSKVFGFVKSSEFALNPATQLWWLWDLYLYPTTLPI